LAAVGVNRALPGDILKQGEWSTTPEGKRVWRLSLQSTGAAALRVRFTDFHVGAGRVWVLGTETIGPYTGDGPFGDGTFWTDMVTGDSLIIAYEPDASAGETTPFRPVEVSHRVARATAKSATADVTVQPLAAAASCSLDVSCYPKYTEPASAVALMIFESGGATYECTGSLISSASQPALPYFLTANHCISTDEEARSLIAIFNYQTPSCGGAAPSLGSLPRVTGASFTAGQSIALGDFTLLKLTAFPSVDVKVLGWSADAIGASEEVAGISHPRGDYKRIAFGQRTRDVTIRFDDGERMAANIGYQVQWSDGVTQSGSSGSPLLVTIGDKQYLTGTLSGGPNVNDNNSAQVCRLTNLTASYGRFSAAFPYLSTYLTSTTTSSGGTGSGQGTITASPNLIIRVAGQALGRTVLSWQASGATQVQVRVGSANGPAMTGLEAPSGSAETGDWVANGMLFYLQDASDGNSFGSTKTIATVQVQVL
jgi:hypothetical protein